MMKNEYKKWIVSLLVLMMIIFEGTTIKTLGLETIDDNVQTIDGSNREHGISQIQTVIPDKIFATAVYDGLERENHFGDGTQSIKEVLSSFDGYVEYKGWKMKTIFVVIANKVEVATGKTFENIEKEFLTEEEAQTFFDALQDTKEFCYLDKRDVYIFTVYRST
ncbi:MAG: hypothetical protein HFF37_07905 [Coprobacillus sp.]|nr:hypothetical protein [Coprobacillus sp.]